MASFISSAASALLASVTSHFTEIQTIEDLSTAELAALPKEKILKAVKFSKHAYLTRAATLTEPELTADVADQITCAVAAGDDFPILLDMDKTTGAQVYIWLSESTDELHLAYRGTEPDNRNLKDVLADIDLVLDPLFPNKKLADVQVHRGFLKQFLSVMNSVVLLMNKHRREFNTVIHTGHSLGGGLACLSAVFFKDRFPRKEHHCITIGCPRPGNQQFAELFRKSIPVSFRIANENDPIPMLATSTTSSMLTRPLQLMTTIM